MLCVKNKHSQENPTTEELYYHDQIIGLQVRTTTGEFIGTVTDILSGVSNDNYIVRSSTGEVLVPAIEDVVRSINLTEGIITIEAIDGLLDLNVKKPPKK